MVGEADVPNLPGFQLAGDPLLYAQPLQLLPGGRVREHVHQVVVHVVRPQAAELLPEDFFCAGGGFDEVVGQLGGQIHLVPAAGPAEDFPHRRLVAGVDVSGIQVVHATLDGGHDLPLRLVQVDAAALAGETHTSVAQEGNLVSLFVLPILHIDGSFLWS